MLVPSFDINLVSSFCDLFRSMVTYGSTPGDISNTVDKGINWKKDESEARELLQLCWAYAFIWGIGGNIEGSSQKTFDEWFPADLDTGHWTHIDQ